MSYMADNCAKFENKGINYLKICKVLKNKSKVTMLNNVTMMASTWSDMSFLKIKIVSCIIERG